MSRMFTMAMAAMLAAGAAACSEDSDTGSPDAAVGGGGGTGGQVGGSGGSGGNGGGIVGGSGGAGGVVGGSGGSGGATGGSGGATGGSGGATGGSGGTTGGSGGSTGGSGGSTGGTGGTGGAGGGPGDCTPDECGPPPPLPGLPCPDGTIAVPVCDRGDDGVCGWHQGECPPPADRCAQPIDPGPCEAAMPRWAYDPAAGECVEFTYGGCQGNANNFLTLEDCQAACPDGPDVACGGRAGPTCTDLEFCDFAGPGCDFADAQGVCRPRPLFCPEIFGPVCACDGETYDNWCFAQAAGTDENTVGECGAPPVEMCDDFSRDVILLGGALSYGECLEGCNSTLTIGPSPLDRTPCDGVSLTVCDNGLGANCTEHGGSLTAVGHRAARDLAIDLDGVDLLETYGCPDCADGGASTVSLDRHGLQTSHRYETSNPPAELAPADLFVQGLIQSLRACESSPDIDVWVNCVPRQ